jgi:hypothetical protein
MDHMRLPSFLAPAVDVDLHVAPDGRVQLALEAAQLLQPHLDYARGLGQAFGNLLSSGAHLRGVNPVTGRNRLDRFYALEGFQRVLGFKLCIMTTALG